MNLEPQIQEIARKISADLIETRRHLHMHPELSFQEFQTTEFLASYVEEKGYGTLERITETGGYVDLKGVNPDSSIIALRADIDALPILEQNEVEYRSKNPGVMHACGHDVHTTSLLGAMEILHQLKEFWQGTIRCIFQPGEERIPGGASIMINEGVLKNPDVQSIQGQHVMPLLPAGTVGFRPGLYMASADEIYIRIKGKGGHGAHPHMNIDPVTIAASIIQELQFVVSRHAKPAIPNVLSIGKVIAEGATNVIPDEVYMEGTFRTYNEEWRAEAHKLIAKTAQNICAIHDAKCEVEVRKGYPFLKNDENLTALARSRAEKYLGTDKVVDLEIWPAGEDFAYYSQIIPACFYRLGTANEEKGLNSMLHTPNFNVDEKSLEVGAGLMAYLAICEANENHNSKAG
ncbi:amidohydrolase [bacterium]|nr:amidohydrolase [bacterium]